MRTAIVPLCLAVLVGCAQTPQKPSTIGEGQAPDVTEVARMPPPQTSVPPQNEAPMPESGKGSNTFDFAPMSVALSADQEARILALAGAAKAAGRITVRGFCDRTAVGNAKEAAIARAVAVRQILVKAGIPATKVRVRYVTEEARHAAVVILQ